MSACCRLRQVGDGEEIGRLEVGDDEAVALRQQLLRLVDGVGVRRQQGFQEIVVLAEQPAGAVVLVERDARALDAFVLHLLVDEGKRRRLLIVLGEVDDGRRQRRGIARLGGFRLGEEPSRRRQRRGSRRRGLRPPNLRNKAGANAGTSTFTVCYNLSLSPVSQPVPIGSSHRFARVPAAARNAAAGHGIASYQWRRSGPPANTVRIQAMIFHTSWSVSISSPNGGIGPTTPSVALAQ